MTYLTDLGPYTYYESDSFSIHENGSSGLEIGAVEYLPAYDRVAIGWLDPEHAFTTGPVPAEFPDALLDVLAAVWINVMLGFHPCELCPASVGDVLPVIDYRGQQLRLGNGELRVPAGPGVMYAAPSLIFHYVTEHNYQPPAAFIAAVLSFDATWFTRPGTEWIPADAERITY